MQDAMLRVPARLGAYRRIELAWARCSNRLAQTNSVARMPSPKGITRIPGPGNTIIATPMSSTVNPITATIARLSQLSLFISFFLEQEILQADFIAAAARKVAAKLQ